MSKTSRVMQWSKPTAYVVVENGATVGATVGQNLYWPDGSVVQVADFGGDNTVGPSPTTDFVREGRHNLYYTPARVYAKVRTIIQAGDNIALVWDDDAQTVTVDVLDGSGSGLDADLLRGTTPSTAGLALLDDADAAAQRTTMGAEKLMALRTITDASDDLESAWDREFVRFTSASAKTLNVRTNATHAVETGYMIGIRNSASAEDLTIAPAGGVTITAPAGGTLVLEPAMSALLIKVGTDAWELSGQTVAA